jgi:signal transduction histidine kinase
MGRRHWRELNPQTEAEAVACCYLGLMRRAADALIDRQDSLLVAGLFAMGAVEALVLAEQAPLWWQLPLAVVWTAPLLWRRRWPVVVLALVIVMGPALELVNDEGGVMSFVLSAVVAAYSVGRLLDPPSTWWGPALTVGFGWIVFAVTRGALSDFVFVALLYGGAWAVGHAIRRRDVQVGELTREKEELRRTHQQRELMAVEHERARIARELHDIVSHGISVITIQAQALRHRVEPTNDEAAEVLRGIETTARQAMGDMRRLLGVLRSDGEPPALAPQPGLADFPALVSETRAAGVDVDMVIQGAATPLPPGIDLVAYRVVQEALTNVRKHAGVASAVVVLRYQPEALDIEVADEGRPRLQPLGEPVTGGGHGLAGMRERVALYGGTVAAGPAPDGGFRVQVLLPLMSEMTTG